MSPHYRSICVRWDPWHAVSTSIPENAGPDCPFVVRGPMMSAIGQKRTSAGAIDRRLRKVASDPVLDNFVAGALIHARSLIPRHWFNE